MTRKWLWLLAVTGLCLLTLTVPSTAQKNVGKELTEDERSAIRQERMQKLIMAQELAAEGRKSQSPETLLAAASILRSLSGIGEMNKAAVSEVRPEIKGDGKAELDAAIPPLTLLEQSDQIFKDASDIAADVGVNKEVDKLIALIKKREIIEERAVVGGPKQVCRKIGGGQTHSYTFKIFTIAPLPFVYRSTLPLRVSIVRDDDFNAYYKGVTMHMAHTFHPGYNPAKKTAPITVRISNMTKLPAEYQFMFQ